MDVTADNFWEMLPNIMLIISCSDYIALDMEMTGIKIKDSLPRGAPPTMEQVYDRVRSAASTFQAVQIGMTCLRWTGTSYQSFTFTIPISPMFAADTKVARRMAEIVDRKLTLSYQSLVVLQSHGFNLGETLGQGVPYLSREELQHVRGELLQVKTYGSIDPPTLDSSDKKFYTGLVEELRAWVKTRPDVGAVFRVFDPRGGTLRRVTIRGVYGLVREVFPECRCWRDSDNWAMNIEIKDEEAECKRTDSFSEAVRDAIRKQLALLWVIESLINNGKFKDDEDFKYPAVLFGLEDIILISLGQDPAAWPRDPQAQWLEIVRKIKDNKPILIGHNVICDLCFLHSMFIGQLPDKLEDFRQRIHDLLPRVLDTKVLVSQAVDPDVVDQTLEQLFSELECQSHPFVSSVPGWTYNRQSRSIGVRMGSAHNAGFDSYMTAVVFLKLSTRQLMLQEKEFQTASCETRDGENRWQRRWLDDPDRHDPYVLSQGDPEGSRLPGFDTGFFEPVRNRLRMSFAGILKLEETVAED